MRGSRKRHLTGQFMVALDALLGPRARAAATRAARWSGGAGHRRRGQRAFTLTTGTAPTGDGEGPRFLALVRRVARPPSVRRATAASTSRRERHPDTGHSSERHHRHGGTGTRTRARTSPRPSLRRNSYQGGTASFRLPGLAPGPHSIVVSAAANLASGINAALHRASARIDFEVSETPALRCGGRSCSRTRPARRPGSGGQFVIDAPGIPSTCCSTFILSRVG